MGQYIWSINSEEINEENEKETNLKKEKKKIEKISFDYLIKKIKSNKYFKNKNFQPNKICEKCNINIISKQMQNSNYNICRKCYLKEKEENFANIKTMLNKQKELSFFGNEIITNKLFLGSIKDSFQKDNLKKLGITNILMVGYFLNEIYPNDFTYLNFEIDDNPNENIFKYFLPSIKFILKSKVCFVHCILGKSRSASIVICFVMFYFKISFKEAFKFVKRKRIFISPNESFCIQLKYFDFVLKICKYDLRKIEEFMNKFNEQCNNDYI